MDRTILITGGSSGIGLGLKNYFLSKGDRVIDFSLESKDYPCDITNDKSLSEAFEKIKGEKLDILINCAGRGLSGAIELVSEEQIRAQFELNVFALINVTKRALPMLKNDGKIINIASTCALFAMPFRSYYCATKAAVNMLSDGLRMELKKHTNIQVGSICPGEIKTNFTKNRVKDFATNERYGDSVKNSAAYVDSHESKRMPVDKAVKKMAKYIEKKRLKPQIIIGKQKFLYVLRKFVPKSIWLWATQKIFVK